MNISKYFKRKKHKLEHINSLILDSLDYPCMIVDENRNIVSANKVALEVGSVIGGKCWNTFGQNLCLSDENLKKAESGDIKNIECTFCQADDCISKNKSMNDDQVEAFGKIWDTYWVPINKHYILHYAIEVTEERSYEKKLKESEEFLGSTLNDLLIGVVVHNHDTSILFCNPEAIKILGLTYDQMLGKKAIDPSWNFVHEDNTIMELEDYPVSKVISTKISIRNYIIGVKRPDKDCITWINTSGIPIFNSTGDIDKVIINFIDITYLKKSEKALKESELKLYRAKKMEAIGLMAGGVAHDLNNVLSGIVTIPELMLMNLKKDDPMVKHIKTIMKSGEKANAIVSELLTIARGVMSKKITLNMNELISLYLESAEFIKLLIYKNVNISVNLEEDLLPINASKIHIDKLILNLVGNAVESIEDKGDVFINSYNVYLDAPLSGYEDIAIGEYVHLQVKDSGCGISNKDLDHIFEPFYTKKEMGISGTGLGLAVVWNVVQDHNGYINVSSSKNGTIFDVYFPVSRKPIEDSIIAKDFTEYKGNNETVLVIDDSPTQLDICKSILTQFNYKIKLAQSGEKGIERLKKNNIDVVILDMIMPGGINGYETYVELKRIKPDIKVILASGHAKDELVEKSLELGVTAYIKKPYRVDEICKVIRNILKER
jgi:two-component system, cell cycle sensor histidine kinase and response regulator CckA